MLRLSDSSYPVTFLGWLITHPPPQGPPPQSPSPTKNNTKITTFALAVFFVGEEGNSPLKTIKCYVFQICPTPLASWGGASPICHPRGPPHSPKAAKINAEITRFSSVVFSVGREGSSPLNTIKCKVFLICPTLTPSKSGKSPICHPRDPPT